MTPDLTGPWAFHGHPWNAKHPGQITIDLTQQGNTLTGSLVQRISPQTGEPPRKPHAGVADVTGEVIEHDAVPLVMFRRLNRHSPFRAVFVGRYNPDQDTVTGTFCNTSDGGGTFIMERAR